MSRRAILQAPRTERRQMLRARLASMSPADARAYARAHSSTLAEARDLLGDMAALMVAMAGEIRELRGERDG